MWNTMLCAALAAWSLGGGNLQGTRAQTQLRIPLAPAGKLPTVYPHTAGLWAGALLRPVAYVPVPVRSEPSDLPGRGLCAGRRFGVNGRPVSGAWGSRQYLQETPCERNLWNEGGLP